MKDLLKGKMIITYQNWGDDGELIFVLIVDRGNFAKTMDIIDELKYTFYSEGSEYEMFSDAVYYALEAEGIECLMPDFEEA